MMAPNNVADVDVALKKHSLTHTETDSTALFLISTHFLVWSGQFIQ